MEIKLKKQYYNETEKNNEGQDIVKDELKPMYVMTIQENYFTGDKQQVLRQAIKDLEKELVRLKEIDRANEKTMESWDSISK